MCGKESLEDKSPGEAEAVHLGPHQAKARSDDKHCLWNNCDDHHDKILICRGFVNRASLFNQIKWGMMCVSV